jgi:predicted dehydrogenase
MSDERTPYIGIVGCGNIGHRHAQLLREQDIPIAGGADIAAEARDRFADEFGVPTFEDHGALYAEADAVIVTTPNRYHEEPVVEALEAGLDVLVEKPLANDVESAERIAAAAREADGFCMVGFHTRFESDVEVVTDYREAGRFGDVDHVEASYIRRRGVPGRGSWFTRKDVSGGGALIDIGVHALDLSLYLLGYPDVEEVTGVTRSQFGGREDYTYLSMWGDDQGAEGFDVDDSASVFVRCADGKTISLEVAWATNRPPAQEYVLRGSGAGATIDKSAGELTVHETGTEGGGHMSDSAIETDGRDAHAAEQAYFVEHVAEGTTPTRNTVEQGLTVQRVLDAIYESDETGSAVSIED